MPADAVPWIPDVFCVECGAVLRRWDLNANLIPAEIATAIDQLVAWPPRVTVDLVSDDHKLANTLRPAPVHVPSGASPIFAARDTDQGAAAGAVCGQAEAAIQLQYALGLSVDLPQQPRRHHACSRRQGDHH